MNETSDADLILGLRYRHHKRIARIIIESTRARICSHSILRRIGDVNGITLQLPSSKNQMRTLHTCKLYSVSVVESDDGSLSLRCVVPAERIAPGDTCVCPCPTVCRESMSSSGVQP